MIINRLFKRLDGSAQDEDGLGRGGCAIIMIGGVILVALIMRIVFWALPEKTAPLLAEADGLLRFEDIPSADPYTTLPLFLPENLLGSAVHVVGVYTKPSEVFPQESTVIVLEKDDWRFADITINPRSTFDVLENRYKKIGSSVVVGDAVGYLVDLPAAPDQCLPPTKEGIGACTLQTILFFPTETLTLTLAGDATHITDGELLLLARDIVQQIPKETPPMP